MASDSQTASATSSEKPLEKEVNATLMEKEIVLSETADKQVSDSNLAVTKEEQTDQTPAGEPEKESPAVVEADESTEKGKDENGEQKVAEQVELKEPILVKECVEAVDEEKKEEKQTVGSVAEEENKDKEETKMVHVSESTIGKEVEPVDVQSVREVSVEDKVKDVEVLEVEPIPEASEKVEAQPEKAKELAPEVEVVKAEETPETTEQAKVELEGKLEEIIVKTEDSGEKTSEAGSALCPEEIVPTNKDSDTALKKETEGDDSSPADVIEKAITEEKHVVEEPSKDEQENVSEAKDVVTKLATEDENIKKDTEPAAQDKSEETLKEADTESREKETAENKQEESITEKVAEVVKESDEPKQQPEVTTKDVAVKQKHSNSIMSKVKQSLVKAKKAIIGKSPSSKTISTQEAKGEIKVE